MVRNRNLVMLVRRERLIAARALPWLPRWLHFLSRNRFESARKLASVKSPVLIVHGDLDRTIPVAEAQLLFAAANEPKKLMIIPGAGHNIFGSLGEEYLTQVDQFIRESLQATPRLNVADGEIV